MGTITTAALCGLLMSTISKVNVPEVSEPPILTDVVRQPWLPEAEDAGMSVVIIEGELVVVEVDPAEFAGRDSDGDGGFGRVCCCGPPDATSGPTSCIDWSEDPSRTKGVPAEESARSVILTDDRFACSPCGFGHEEPYEPGQLRVINGELVGIKAVLQGDGGGAVSAPEPTAPPLWVQRPIRIGDPGRAAVEVRAGLPTGAPVWADTVLDAALVPGLEVRAASVRGVVHRHLGTARQDAYSLVWLEDWSALLVTVCDGLGSFEASHVAAALVAARMPAHLGPAIEAEEVDWATAFTAVSAELDETIQSHSLAMATTAMCALIRRAGDGRHRVDLGWVGDGGAYRLTPSGWEVLGGEVKTVETGSAPLSSATAALPGSDVAVDSAVVEFEMGTALFVMTDGVADPLGGGQGEVGDTLARWWARPPEALEFAAQIGFARKSFDDDRTVVGVWAIGEEDPR